MDAHRPPPLVRWRRLYAAAFIAVPAVLAVSCTVAENRPLSLGDDRGDASAPSFTKDPETEGDGGGPVPTAEYCPSTQCPAGLTTCPMSQFACDIDLKTDVRNCGSCGFRCYSNSALEASCVDGKCELRCTRGNADCNGVLDDECETKLGSNENCNGCGDTCPDPEKPCIYDSQTGTGRCGCAPGLVYCGTRCVDPATNDAHCGACGVACDPNGGDGGTLPTRAYYGCSNSECGRLKCRNGFANCDGDVTNGCEVSLLSNEHCGGCGLACAPGQTCFINRNAEYECACGPGKTLCGSECVDFLTDPRHCGSCDINCLNSTPEATGIAFCSFGSCGYGCAEGRGDCNGDSKDGCETNLGSDPENCGACGNTCDLAAGQPCVRGRCAVEVCDGGVITQ